MHTYRTIQNIQSVHVNVIGFSVWVKRGPLILLNKRLKNLLCIKKGHVVFWRVLDKVITSFIATKCPRWAPILEI